MSGSWKGIRFILSSLLLSLLTSCATLPVPLSDTERQSIMTAHGKAELFDAMLAEKNNQKIDSILVLKDGHTVFERYFNGYSATDKHDLRSSTKAITALLIGIAIEHGKIRDVDQSIMDFFPERAASNPEFKAIRIRDLLSMRSGLDANDWDAKSPGNEENMYR